MDESIIPRSGLEYNLSSYHPLDVLYHINPEIASVAYANRAGILRPEAMPLIATFRECQRDEQLGRLHTLVEMTRIGADERMNLVINETQERITSLQEDGATKRTWISEKEETTRTDLQERGATQRTYLEQSGATNRTQLECSAAMKISELKYDADVRIIQEQMAGQRYLSDNQLRATHLEAQALGQAIISKERIAKLGAMVQMRESQDKMRTELMRIEVDYLTKMRESEDFRWADEGKRKTEIVNNYLLVQAQMCRAAVKYHLIQAQLKLGETKATYRAITDITKSATEVFTQTDSTELTVEANTPMGQVNITVKRK